MKRKLKKDKKKDSLDKNEFSFGKKNKLKISFWFSEGQ